MQECLVLKKRFFQAVVERPEHAGTRLLATARKTLV